MPYPVNHRLLLGALYASFLLPSCGDSQRPLSEQSVPVAAHSVPSKPRFLADSITFVFNVPALVSLTADQIKSKLGKPASDAQESINDEMKRYFTNVRATSCQLIMRYGPAGCSAFISLPLNPGKHIRTYCGQQTSPQKLARVTKSSP